MGNILNILKVLAGVAADPETEKLIEDGVAYEKRVVAWIERHPEVKHLFDQPSA
jgi:hypothetical protein